MTSELHTLVSHIHKFPCLTNCQIIKANMVDRTTKPPFRRLSWKSELLVALTMASRFVSPRFLE
jgi:hypothetical protein